MAGDRRQLKVLEKPIEDGSVGGGLDVSEADAVRQKLAQVDGLERQNARPAGRRRRRLRARRPPALPQRRVPRDLGVFGRLARLGSPEESEILDRLRAERKLPEQSNYRDWRSKHLAAYLSAAPREDLWHLPDGRTLRVVAVPNSDGGMSYIYENVTEQISLESRLAALSHAAGRDA